jgi:hypothetical protein
MSVAVVLDAAAFDLLDSEQAIGMRACYVARSTRVARCAAQR